MFVKPCNLFPYGLWNLLKVLLPLFYFLFPLERGKNNDMIFLQRKNMNGLKFTAVIIIISSLQSAAFFDELAETPNYLPYCKISPAFYCSLTFPISQVSKWHIKAKGNKKIFLSSFVIFAAARNLSFNEHANLLQTVQAELTSVISCVACGSLSFLWASSSLTLFSRFFVSVASASFHIL